jgi:lysophospholipase L1-like esterase
MKRSIALLAAALAVCGVVRPVGASADPVTPSRPLKYVAMGDSYDAAGGNFPLVPNQYALPCVQSLKNYPHLIAAELGASLTDVSCGGAVAAGFWNAQYPWAPPQFDALTADTDLVTLHIGGNDHLVFPGSAISCGLMGIATGGKGQPCTKAGLANWQAREDASRADIKRAIAGVRERAPHATVAVLGYPWLIPPTGGCFQKMPVAAGDVPALHALEQHLNDILREVATEVGATFVDMSQVSTGHDACAPPGVRWIEPALFPKGGLQFVHPNALGEQKMAEQTLKVLGLG